jgi:5-methylcytosine-specific restriction endonuclease McrA
LAYSEEELLENLREIASQVEGSLSKKEFVNHDDSMCSTKPFYTNFGTWNEAKREAGLEVGKPAKLTRQNLLDEIHRLADEVRNPPRESDLEEHGKYSPPPYRDEFGSWTEAVDAAGLEPYENLDPYTEITCPYCGTEKKKQKTNIRNQDKFFCSRSCKEAWASENRVGEGHPQYDRVTIECEVCGDEFDVKPSVVEVRKTCSDSCQSEWQSMKFSGEDSWSWDGGKEEVSCANCGKVKQVKQAVAEGYDTHFCGEECIGEWRSENWTGSSHPNWEGGKEIVECANCGNNTEVKTARLESQDRVFCSRDCWGQWISDNWRGENHPSYGGGYRGYYGPSWDEARRKVRERDDYTCQRCGIDEESHIERYGVELHTHHVEPFRNFENHEEANELGNLLLLCASCHREIEGLPIDNR